MNKKAFHLLIFLWLILMLMPISAFSQKEHLAPGYEAGAHKALSFCEIKITYTDQLDSSSLASKLGFFDEFNVQPILTEFQSGNSCGITIGVMDVVEYLSCVGKGSALYYVSADIKRDIPLVVKKNSGINGPGDLKGKKLGLPGKPSLEYLFLLKALKANNLSPDDVKFVVAKNNELATLLDEGTVDAITARPPWILKPMIEGWGEEVSRLSDVFGKAAKGAATDIIVVSQDTKLVQQCDLVKDDKMHEDTLIRYLAALEKLAFASLSSDEIVKEYAAKTGLDQGKLKDILGQYEERLVKRRIPMSSYLNIWIDQMSKLGILDQKLNLGDVTYFKAAKWASILRRYGVEKW